MTWTGIGELTLGAVVPLAGIAQANLSSSVGIAIPEIQAKLDGAVKAQTELVTHPLTLAAQLSAAESAVASLTALIDLDLPGISLNLDVIAALVLELQGTIGSLSASATFAADLGALLGTPGVYLVRHTGAVGDVMPGGLPGGLGPEQPVDGIAILATDAGAWTAIQALFRTTT